MPQLVCDLQFRRQIQTIVTQYKFNRRGTMKHIVNDVVCLEKLQPGDTFCFDGSTVIPWMVTDASNLFAQDEVNVICVSLETGVIGKFLKTYTVHSVNKYGYVNINEYNN
jgi:hypothetical protein